MEFESAVPSTGLPPHSHSIVNWEYTIMIHLDLFCRDTRDTAVHTVSLRRRNCMGVAASPRHQWRAYPRYLAPALPPRPTSIRSFSNITRSVSLWSIVPANRPDASSKKSLAQWSIV